MGGRIKSYFDTINQIFPLTPFIKLFIYMSWIFRSLLQIILLSVGFMAIFGINDPWYSEWDNDPGEIKNFYISLIDELISSKWKKFYKHPGTWLMKIFIFHLVMISKYLWDSSWDWTQKQLVFILGVILGPIVRYCPCLIYGVIVNMLALESVFLNNKNVKRKGSNKTQTKICLLQVFEMHPPVPRSWASLNGVQLNQEFVG